MTNFLLLMAYRTALKTLFQRGVHNSLDGVHAVFSLIEHLGLLGREHLVGNFHLRNAELR